MVLVRVCLNRGLVANMALPLDQKCTILRSKMILGLGSDILVCIRTEITVFFTCLNIDNMLFKGQIIYYWGKNSELLGKLCEIGYGLLFLSFSSAQCQP